MSRERVRSVWDYRKQLREYNEARRRSQEADRPARWPRLSPDAAARHVALLRKAGRIARTLPARRPCDHRPWNEALDLATRPAPEIHPEPVRRSWRATLGIRDRRPPNIIADEILHFFRFSSDAASGGGWPPEHAHLVDFALTFLEEDVMLFRSGYTKKALARRLKQATLTESDVARLPILQRTVLRGTGLEEFKPLCRLAQKVRPPGLWEWLEAQRGHPDIRVRRNAHYMREAGTPWSWMHPEIERLVGLGPP